MTVFRFSPRWPDIARTWDDEGTARVWRAAVELLDQRDRDIEDYLRRMLSSIDLWTPWTPTLYFGVTVLGHQTLTGRRLDLGRLHILTLHSRITNIGGAAGVMAMDLPVAQRVFTDPVHAEINAGGQAAMIDVSVPSGFTANLSPNAAGTQINFRGTATDPSNPWTNLYPTTWAAGASGTGDELGFTYLYEGVS